MRKRKCSDGISTCTVEDCQRCIERRPKCIVCGATVSRRSKGHCSSARCRGLTTHARSRNTEYHERLTLWLNDQLSADGANGRDRAGLAGWARAYLLEEAGYACTQCGWDTPHPDTGIPPIEVDHIDGNRNNNLRSNVRVLCPNCHALTPTNKGRNRNKYKIIPR